jgi:hypothetical protein
MRDLLQEELTGPPATVVIVGKSYPIAFTMAAAIAYKKATGKSLFDLAESKQISLAADPERWLACLWAGLHQEDEKGEWTAPLTLPQLKRLRIVGSQLTNIDAAMWAAFANGMPKSKEDADPKDAAPGELEPVPSLKASPGLIGSTRAPDVVSASGAESS